MNQQLNIDLTDSVSVFPPNAALNELSDIRVMIDLVATRLVECRKLRLDAITSDEIKVLERKLFKRFSELLDAKCKSFSDLDRFSSLPSLLHVSGVSSCLTKTLKCRKYTIEKLMKLPETTLDSTIRDMGGTLTDIEKLSSALSVLKKFNGASDTSASSRNGSESSGSNLSDICSIPTRIQIELSSSSEVEPASQRQHSTEIPSTSSSMTPPSPTHGSHSSIESDSAFATSRSQGSPPPRIALNINSLPYASSTPTTPATPHKLSQQLLQSNSGGFTTNNKEISRDRFPSAGAKASYSVSTSKLKLSKSSEWHVGSKEPLSFAFGNMSGSSQSLASNPGSPVTKHAKAHKKKSKSRPINLSVETENLDFISIMRPTVPRRGSFTTSPEGTDNAASLPLRTPVTPAPSHHEIGSKDSELASSSQSLPTTPKIPKSNFEALKNLFRRKFKKIKRNKSSEHLPDEDVARPVHRRRSGTLPSSKNYLLQVGDKTFPASNPSSTCATPLASPDFSPFDADDSRLSSSRRPSLVDTDKTIVADENNSNTVNTPVDREQSVEQNDTAGTRISTLFRQGSQIHAEEWDINFGDMELINVIGSGRVGTVHRGYWHGDVAIRVIKINSNEEEKLQAFKQELGVFKKTRHENLELFMGSSIDPPRLAIVTGFCRGKPLYNYIRDRDSKNKSSHINHAKLIVQHIAQGMGYLHSKGIVHKDLKSKNIFVEGKRVVITGFGLVGLHAVASDYSRNVPGELAIPDGWLCYLAPELITSIAVPLSERGDVISTLPYTTMTDVYAFGTVWYELLAGSWPFEGLSAECIIWMVGSGKKQDISQIQVGKELLDQCWAYDSSQRPDFDKGFVELLEKLPSQMNRVGSSRPTSSRPRRPGLGARPISHDRLLDSPHLRRGQFSALHELAE